jgi:hypothetical protein
MTMWSITLNPTYEFVREEGYSVYATGGYGVYNRRLELTNTFFQRAIVCDDWWGVCTTGFVSDEEVVADRSTYKGGFNVGTGFTLGSRSKFFMEVRYHHMFTTNEATQVIPITFGIRW